MKVLIDGKEVQCHNDVKVIYENRVVDMTGELHITVNSEGVIADCFVDGGLYTTSWQDLEDIVESTF